MIFLIKILRSRGVDNLRYRLVKACHFIVFMLSFALPGAYATTTVGDSGQVFFQTPEIQRPERNHGVLDVDKVDLNSGALRITNEDIRLKNGALDLVVSRNYAPLMSYANFYNPNRGMRPHHFAEIGMGGGWSFAVAPKVILNGNGKIASFRDKLCTGEDWPRGGMKNGYGPYGEKIFGLVSSDDVEYEMEALNFFTSFMIQHTNGQMESMVPTKVGEVRSGSGWKLTCSGKSYTLHGPDGIKYELNQEPVWHGEPFYADKASLTYLLQTSKIVDPNGNWVSIEYSDEFYPRKISSSDGSIYLNFSYKERPKSCPSCGTDRFLAEITDNVGRSWKYLMVDRDLDDPDGRNGFHGFTGASYYENVIYRLKEVILPDGTKWSYNYWSYPDPQIPLPLPAVPLYTIFNACAGANIPDRPADNYAWGCQRYARGGLLSSMVYPTGGSVSYTYANAKGYYAGSWPWETYYDKYVSQEADNDIQGLQARFLYSSQVKTRTLSTGQQWTYDFQIGPNNAYDVTTVNTPDGVETYKHIGWSYFYGQTSVTPAWPYTPPGVWKVGLLMEKKINDIYTESYEWVPLELSSFWPDRNGGIGQIADPNQTFKAVLKTKRITVNGASHVSEFSNWDTYGNPQTLHETGPNGGDRTTNFSYLNDTAKWIIGRPKNQISQGSSIIREFDTRGNLLSQSQDGVVTTYSYDASGNMIGILPPRGLYYSYSDFKRGIPQTEVHPEGLTISRVIDNAGNVVSEKNGVGATTTYAYDAMNRVTAIGYPSGNPAAIAYTANSKTATRGGLVETTQYDGFGRAASITLGGITTKFHYDAMGRIIFKSNPDSSIGTSYEFDAMSRITRINNSDGTYQLRAYGPATTYVIDERSQTNTSIFRSYGNPAESVLMGVTAPDPAASIVIERNASDQVTSVKQAGVVRSFGYDANKYLTSVTNPESGVTTYGRDAAGNMTSRRNSNGVTARYIYDGHSRLTETSYSDGTPTVSVTYNKLHKILTSSASGGNRSYGYDLNGNVISETLVVNGQAFTAAYSYNANDQLSSITYPYSNRVIDYAPDELGRPTQVGGYVNHVYYWPSGQIKQIDYANGTVSRYGQNERLWPSYFDTQRAFGTLYVGNAYSYDGAGNLQAINDAVDANFNRGLGYDAMNRLVTVNGPWGAGAISYNGAGDITTQQYGSWNLYYSYSNGKLSSVSGAQSKAYSYDAYGNVVNAGASNYAYDAVPNLRCANCTDAASKTVYTYDAINQRSSVLKAGVMHYEMHGVHGNQLIEFTPQKNKLIEYFYLGGKRIAQQVSP